MNIFILDNDPEQAAKAHCDKHTIKMILESAQLLSTAINTHSGKQVMPYKTTHLNHPCSIWVRESRDNALWLVELTTALNAEYKYRYNKSKNENHKSYDMLITAKIKTLIKSLPATPQTPPALAMPDKYWVMDSLGMDAVASYRNYYKNGKADLLNYTRREPPEWLGLAEIGRGLT